MGRGRDVVAVILAAGLAVALVVMVAAVFYDAVRSDTPGLSENATQVVIAAFTGITGILGGYIGGRAVERAHEQARRDVANPDVPAPADD